MDAAIARQDSEPEGGLRMLQCLECGADIVRKDLEVLEALQGQFPLATGEVPAVEVLLGLAADVPSTPRHWQRFDRVWVKVLLLKWWR